VPFAPPANPAEMSGEETLPAVMPRCSGPPQRSRRGRPRRGAVPTFRIAQRPVAIFAHGPAPLTLPMSRVARKSPEIVANRVRESQVPDSADGVEHLGPVIIVPKMPSVPGQTPPRMSHPQRSAAAALKCSPSLCSRYRGCRACGNVVFVISLLRSVIFRTSPLGQSVTPV